MNAVTGYNFAYLDEGTKRMIRRAILKAIAIPGYQVPFASREMPMPYGWGTGGVQVTAAILGRSDVLKVIDQGSDDTTNAVSIRAFFARTADVAVTTRTRDATVIQTRHRIPEAPLSEGQVLVYQVPIPEPLRFLEPRETETRQLHALAEYGLMHVKLYEDIARHGHIATTYAYPVEVGALRHGSLADAEIRQPEDGRLPGAPALRRRPREADLRRAAPHRVRSLDFEDHPSGSRPSTACALCGAEGSTWMKCCSTMPAGGCSSARIPTIARSAGPDGMSAPAAWRRAMSDLTDFAGRKQPDLPAVPRPLRELNGRPVATLDQAETAARPPRLLPRLRALRRRGRRPDRRHLLPRHPRQHRPLGHALRFVESLLVS